MDDPTQPALDPTQQALEAAADLVARAADALTRAAGPLGALTSAAQGAAQALQKLAALALGAASAPAPATPPQTQPPPSGASVVPRPVPPATPPTPPAGAPAPPAPSAAPLAALMRAAQAAAAALQTLAGTARPTAAAVPGAPQAAPPVPVAALAPAPGRTRRRPAPPPSPRPQAPPRARPGPALTPRAISGAIGSAAGAVAGAVGVVGAVVDALASIPGRVREFVDAFDPAVVRGMDAAFRSLQATIGFALAPVVEGFTSLFRLLASEFNAGFTELRDVVGDVVAGGFNLLRPVVRLVAVQFENVIGIVKALQPALAPLFGFLEDNLVLFTTMTQIVAQLLGAFVEFNAEFTSAFVQLITQGKNLHETFALLAFAVIKTTDSLLRMVGLSGLADKIRESFTRTPPPGRMEGLRDQRIGGIEEIYRARLLEAAKAQAGPQAKQESVQEILKGMIQRWEANSARQQGLLDTLVFLLKAGIGVNVLNEGRKLIDKYAPEGSAARGSISAINPMLGLVDWLSR